MGQEREAKRNKRPQAGCKFYIENRAQFLNAQKPEVSPNREGEKLEEQIDRELENPHNIKYEIKIDGKLD